MSGGDKPREDVAVALRYSGQGAPRVTAKGRGEVAAQIRELADAHEVPTYTDPELANVLARVELGAEIPEALYLAVAEVIAFAYMLRGDWPAAGERAAPDGQRRGLPALEGEEGVQTMRKSPIFR